MTRQQRRAAERNALKQARRAISIPETAQPTQTEPRPQGSRLADSFTAASEPHSSPDASGTPTVREGLTEARLTANRANAQFSTGPKSDSGKATSSKNALKTALTGRTVLLPGDDADRYEQHLAAYDKAYAPVGERECELVQSLADTTWRIDRIPGLEEALYVKGCNQFAAEVTDLDPRARLTMLRMHTYLAYERQFRNLNIQEMRLHRLREKLIAEIKQLQKERDQKEKDELAQAAKLYIAAKTDRKPFDPADHGFEFTTHDVECYLHGRRAHQLTEKAFETGRFPQSQHAKAA